MALFIIFILVAISKIICSSNHHAPIYNRTMLQELYPGLGEDFVMFPRENGGFRIGFLKSPLKDHPKIFDLYDVENDVTFTLYTKREPGGLELDNNDRVTSSSFDKSKKTKFVTHGWLSSGKGNICITIKDAFLQKEDVNVIIVDWSKIADNVLYPIPMRATASVAEFYGKFLNQLIEKNGVDPNDVHLIGHSLGAHISGFTARAVKKSKISRVTGLDPALPGFDIELVKGGRLNKNDAQFVDVIHTCAGFLGIKTPLGHADFYPNGGGPPQPGCGNIIEMVEACSHGRSWRLFAESIVLPKPFMAEPCQSYENFLQLGDCDGEAIPMGEPTPSNARGVYYLKTSDEPPFYLDSGFGGGLSNELS